MTARIVSVSLVLATISAVAAAPAPSTYTLRLGGRVKPGQTYTVKVTDKSSTSAAVIIIPALDQPGDPEKRSTEEELVYTETVLEKPEKDGDNPKRLKRTYTKARNTENGKKSTLPYEGQTIILELKGDKYQATAEGKPDFDRKVLDELAEKENAPAAAKGSEKAFLPPQAVKVGEKWTFDGKAITKALSPDDSFVLDEKRSEGDGKLVKVYAKDGRQYGVIELHFKFALKKSGNILFEKPAIMDTKVTLDVVIDGSSSAGTVTQEITMKGRGAVMDKGQKLFIDLATELSGRRERSPER
jgi:hypothetical protein